MPLAAQLLAAPVCSATATGWLGCRQLSNCASLPGPHTETRLSPAGCLPPPMPMPTAGQETSAILLSWTCAYLAHNPEAQAAAAAEVEAHLGGSGGGSGGGSALVAADARKLPYLEAVVLEAMRCVECLPPPAGLPAHPWQLSGHSLADSLATLTAQLPAWLGAWTATPVPCAAPASQPACQPSLLPCCCRLSPPAYLVGRCASQATSLAGYYLPQGEQRAWQHAGWMWGS